MTKQELVAKVAKDTGVTKTDTNMMVDAVAKAIADALAEGETTIRHAERLRLKESDRLQTTSAMLSALGAEGPNLGARDEGPAAARGGTQPPPRPAAPSHACASSPACCGARHQ